jgi:hypothetical protein
MLPEARFHRIFNLYLAINNSLFLKVPDYAKKGGKTWRLRVFA